jgi:pyruvate/2-oxoglutarate dehydrogenase complex dihydrolipoamide dehydrogenase (E3) component
MDQTVYNLAMLTGTALIGGGVALVSVPAALIVVGSLVIGLTFAGAYLSGRKS